MESNTDGSAENVTWDLDMLDGVTKVEVERLRCKRDVQLVHQWMTPVADRIAFNKQGLHDITQ